MLVLFVRIVKFALQNFWRNIWLSVATISIMVLTLLSISGVEFLNVLTRQIVAEVRDRIDISIYFKPEVTPEEVLAIKLKLSKLDKIKDITYLSRDDALKGLEEKHAVVKQTLAELGANPLGDVLIIKATDISYYPLILSALEQSQYRGLIEDKNYEDNQVFLNRISEITSKIKRIGWFTSGIFIVIAILIVFNTIRIAIYTHSDEISVMKLVGASNWFIRAPFLGEALMYAVISTVLTMAVLYPLLRLADPQIMVFFNNSFSLMAYHGSHLAVWFGWHLAATLGLTTIASSLALGRYLDV